MTAAELNRDIKRLANTVEKLHTLNDHDTYFKEVETTVKPEFKRLYLADSQFEYMNKKSILIMLRLNLQFRIIPLHSFGLKY